MARKPIYINPPNRLKEKVGSGGIPPHLLHKGQTYLDNNMVDFTPYARDYLTGIKTYIESVKPEQSSEQTLADLTKIIMQLKASGSMFHYQLISMISDVLLRFLEKVKKTDGDFFDIIKVYTKILTVIIEKKLTGSGGNQGYLLTEELHQACERYNKKYGIS